MVFYFILIHCVNKSVIIKGNICYLIQKFGVGLDTVADKYIKAADVDGNGDINIKDATFIQKYIAGIQIEYNVGSAI